MLSFFSKKRESTDLTVLDPPDLLPHHFKEYMENKSSINAQSFMHRAKQVTDPSPTDSEFSIKSNNSYFITSSGLKGEQERNLVLEQQVKILSCQAAKALDQLNEITKENEYLKRTTGHNMQQSISSTNSSQISSISSDGTMSKGSSMNSLSSFTDNKYDLEIKSLQSEIQTLKRQLSSNNSLIENYKQEHIRLTNELSTIKHKNANIFNKLINSNKKQNLQLEYYKAQLKDLSEQLEDTRKRDHELKQRIMEYDIVSLRSRVLC